MVRRLQFLSGLAGMALTLGAQEVFDEAWQAIPAGGKEELEQVLQTQLNLSKTLLYSGWSTEATAYFKIDSSGRLGKIQVEHVTNNVLREETKRMFRFLRFQRTLEAGEGPYYFTFHFSSEKYRRYLKQKLKFTPKARLKADSSYIVYSRADRSPVYYKNGEDGLSDFILSEMEYPKVAQERSVEGTVIIEFIVETNGFVTGLSVKQPVNAGCTEEAMRVIKQTRWQPAVMNNQFVRYKMSYPITFSLRMLTREGNYAPQSIGN